MLFWGSTDPRRTKRPSSNRETFRLAIERCFIYLLPGFSNFTALGRNHYVMRVRLRSLKASDQDVKSNTEISILNGVLELSSKHIEEIMTPIEVNAIRIRIPDVSLAWHDSQDVVTLSLDAILDHKLVDAMYELKPIGFYTLITFAECQADTHDSQSMSQGKKCPSSAFY